MKRNKKYRVILNEALNEANKVRDRLSKLTPAQMKNLKETNTDLIAREMRKEANKLTGEERKELLKLALKIINHP